MFERAYSKINLSLDITGVREDGYHTLESIFLPLDYYDEIYLTKNSEMIFECNLPYIKFNESNTVYQAIYMMKNEFNIIDNFKIILKKHIPTRAGLAGGSTDGAAIIRAINKMYNLNLSDDKIKELCLKIGADVLFTYYNRPAFVSGVGENIKFFDLKKDYYVLIIKPSLGVSTKECYNKMNCETCIHPNINELFNSLNSGLDFIPYLGNSMEEAAISLLPEIQKAKDTLIEAGAPFALMSGSGSSVFTMSEDKELINKLYEYVKNKRFFVRYTKILKKA